MEISIITKLSSPIQNWHDYGGAKIEDKAIGMGVKFCFAVQKILVSQFLLRLHKTDNVNTKNQKLNPNRLY